MEVKISISSKNDNQFKIKDNTRTLKSEKFTVQKSKDIKQNSRPYNKDGKIKMNLHKNKIVIEELPDISNKLIDMGNNISFLLILFRLFYRSH